MLRELSEVLRKARQGFVDSYGEEQEPGELFIHNRALDTDARILTEIVRALPPPLHLRVIDLIGLGLTGQAAIPFARTLGEKGFGGEGLKFLCIRNNPLGDAGVEAFCKVLPPSLEQFFIHDTGCGNRGMAALTSALARVPKVWRLGVSKNPVVGQDAWCAFFEALPQLTALQYLFAYENPAIGCAGARALATAIPRCSETLEAVVVNDCNIAAAEKQALYAVWGTERDDEFGWTQDEDQDHFRPF